MMAEGKQCGICQTLIAPGSPVTRCRTCRGEYHAECWEENRGCATHGCPSAPQDVDVSSARDAQRSHWGATDKKCPVCGETIEIDAITCPFCRSDFGTIAPMTQSQFKDRFKPTTVQDPFAQTALCILIAGIVPCTAPFNLVIGGIWFLSHRAELKKDNPSHHLMAAIGLCISLIFTFVLVLIATMGSPSSG